MTTVIRRGLFAQLSRCNYVYNDEKYKCWRLPGLLIVLRALPIWFRPVQDFLLNCRIIKRIRPKINMGGF
jgi:hypothetical protein